MFERIEADLMPEQRLLDIFKHARASGQPIGKDAESQEVWNPQEINEVIENKKKVLKIGSERQDEIANRVLIAYRVMKWSFVIALILFMGLKGYSAYFPATDKKVVKESVAKGDSPKVDSLQAK